MPATVFTEENLLGLGASASARPDHASSAPAPTVTSPIRAAPSSGRVTASDTGGMVGASTTPPGAPSGGAHPGPRRSTPIPRAPRNPRLTRGPRRRACAQARQGRATTPFHARPPSHPATARRRVLATFPRRHARTPSGDGRHPTIPGATIRLRPSVPHPPRAASWPPARVAWSGPPTTPPGAPSGRAHPAAGTVPDMPRPRAHPATGTVPGMVARPVAIVGTFHGSGAGARAPGVPVARCSAARGQSGGFLQAPCCRRPWSAVCRRRGQPWGEAAWGRDGRHRRQRRPERRRRAT